MPKNKESRRSEDMKPSTSKRMRENLTKSRKVEDDRNDQDFDKTWDIEKYRREYESEEHWMLRKRFMEKHRDTYPEDKLVCLAQVFTNMELMGCKYPTETMVLVEELAHDIVKEYRESRETRLKRTFVTASSAAENRFKAKPDILAIKESLRLNQYSTVAYGVLRSMIGRIEYLFSELKFDKFVLDLDANNLDDILQRSAIACQMIYRETTQPIGNNMILFKNYINGKKIIEVVAENIMAARQKGYIESIKLLQVACYSVKPNAFRRTFFLEKVGDQIMIHEGILKIYKQSSDGFTSVRFCGKKENGVDDDNNYKWIGKSTEIHKFIRNGGFFGQQNSNDLENDLNAINNTKFSFLIKNYIKSDDIRDLRFGSSFTSSDLSLLRHLAIQSGLRIMEENIKDVNELVIKKNVCCYAVLEEILIKKNCLFKDYYLLQVPLYKAFLYPQYVSSIHSQLQDKI